LALLDWLGIEEVVFGMTGRLGKKEKVLVLSV
jgi:hypothetical protein